MEKKGKEWKRTEKNGIRHGMGYGIGLEDSMVSSMAERKCTKCGEAKPLAEFARDRDRYHARCKSCTRRNTGRTERILETRELAAEGRKRCSRCGFIMELSSFVHKSGSYSADCKECRYKLKVGLGRKYRPRGVLPLAEYRAQAAQRRKEREARVAAERAERRSKKLVTVGLKREHILEYWTWQSMIARCTRKTHPKYKCYGGRGIIVCDRWRNSFAAFLEDVGPKPAKGLSIDRINNDGNYEPGNVRWTDQLTQQRNRRPAKHRKSGSWSI